MRITGSESSSDLNNRSLTALTENLLNNYFTKQVDKNINLAVPLYLIAAYAYYVEDNPIITDDCFDWLAKLLKDNWDSITHFHKRCISLDDLSAGTYLGKYPSIVKGALSDLRKSNVL